MLKIYKSLESGPLQELSLKTLERGAWINIIDPTPYELKVVGNLTEVEPDFLRSALDDEERSHTDVEDDSVMVLTNVPIMREQGSYDTLPLAIIVTQDYIITVCLQDNPVISEFNEKTAKTFRTFKKTRFLFQILYKSATYYLRYLRQISKLSEEIEDNLRHSMHNQEILKLLELQKGLTYFNASLRSNGAVLDKLMRLRNSTSLQAILKVYEEDEDLLEDVIIENKQAREMVEMYSQILSRLADTFSSIISNNLNMVMRFLAAMTILLAIPTVISSFFGMNVDVLYKSATYYLRYLRQISKLSEEIEDNLRHSMHNQEILKLLELQKGLTYFNASLRSNGAVLDKLMRLRNSTSLQAILKVYEEDEDLLEDVIIENKQAREMVEMYSQILSRLADTFSSIISNNLNMVMRFLAAMTILLAIPTVISSFFGMNVDVPMAHEPMAFALIAVMATTLAILCGLYLWKKDMF